MSPEADEVLKKADEMGRGRLCWWLRTGVEGPGYWKGRG
jgi:hypothetical protein